MKIIDPILSGSVNSSGSLTIPRGRANQKPSSPKTGSIFLEISDSGSNLVVYNGSGSTGWQTVGDQATPIAPPVIPSADIEYLVVAGGASGGTANGGGGGAGGYLSSSLSSIESGSSITVTVGAGGSGQVHSNVGNDGSDSSIASTGGTSFTTVTATGGGGGGRGTVGRDGGSGGGGTYGSTNGFAGGSGTVGQGHDGGDALYSSQSPWGGGGGGGAANSGSDSFAAGKGGDGGDGKQSKITGTLTYYAGGGGGGAEAGGTPTGGQGGGSNGAVGCPASSTNATQNTGGGSGGGAGCAASTSGNGGSGVVILAYDSGSVTATGGKMTTRTDGHVVHTFKTSSTFTVGGPSDYPTSQIPTTDLVLHLDPTNSTSYGGSGTTITNLGSGPNATLTNGAGFTDNYWTLDGTNDYITSVDDGSYDIATSADFTMIVWVYVTTTNDYAHFFAWDTQSTGAFKAAPSAYSYQIYWYTPSYSTYDNMSTAYTYGVNAWYQLAMVRRSGVWEGYKNGALVGNDSDAGDTVGFSCTNLNMGYGQSGEYTAQRRGPMLLYNGTALTSDQISLNYDHYKSDYGLS